MIGENEVSVDDIRQVCDDVGCDTNKVIGLLTELKIIIPKVQLQVNNFKGMEISLQFIKNNL